MHILQEHFVVVATSSVHPLPAEVECAEEQVTQTTLIHIVTRLGPIELQ